MYTCYTDAIIRIFFFSCTLSSATLNVEKYKAPFIVRVCACVHEASSPMLKEISFQKKVSSKKF